MGHYQQTVGYSRETRASREVSLEGREGERERKGKGKNEEGGEGER